MTRFSILSIAVLYSVCCAGSARAALRAFTFTGHVGPGMVDQLNVLSGVSQGDPLSGTFAYDTNMPLVGSNEVTADYRATPPIFPQSLQFVVGPHTFTSDDDLSIYVTNDGSWDKFSIHTSELAEWLGAGNRGSLAVNLTDPSHTAFSSTALPGDLDFADFSSRTLALTISSPEYEMSFFTGSIDSLDVTPRLWNADSDNWENAASWTLPAVPTANDNVFINNGTGMRSGGQAIVHTSGPTAANVVLGETIGDSGWLVFQDDPGDLSVERDLVVGKAGNGALDMLIDNSSLTITNRLVIGELPGGVGEVSIQAGTLTSAETEIGSSVGADGVIHVQGVDAVWDNTGSVFVGGDIAAAGGTGEMRVSNAGSITIASTLRAWTPGTIVCDGGTLSTGTLRLSGGSLSIESNGSTVESNAANLEMAGSAVLQDTGGGGGGRWTNSGSLYVGGNETAANGAGSLTIRDGSELVVGGTLKVWGPGLVTLIDGSITTDTLELAGGAFNWLGGTLNLTGRGFVVDSGVVFELSGTQSLLLAGDFTAGDSDDGTVILSMGGTLASVNGYLGKQPTADGSVTLKDAGSAWDVSGSLYVGGDDANSGGTGTLTVRSGAAVNVGGTLKVWDQGAVHLEGGTVEAAAIESSPEQLDFRRGTIRFTSDFTLGNETAFASETLTTGKHLEVLGKTTLEVPLTIDGGSLSTEDLTGAEYIEFRRGTLSFTGAGLAVSGGGPLGDTLVVQDSQQINATNLTNDGEIHLTSVTARIGGGTLTNHGLITGTGRVDSVLSSTSSGEIRVQTGERLVFTAPGAINMGTINLDEGTVEFTGLVTNAADGFISGRGRFRAGDGLINQGVMAFSAGTTDLHGDVTNSAGSRIVVSGGATATFFDDLVHNGAEIRVSEDSSAVFFGDVSGAGPFTGAGTTYFEGDLRPGNSPGTLALEGNAVIGHAGGLVIEIGGTQPGIDYDVLQVGGELALDGDLQVEWLDGFMPLPGDEFTVLTFGTRSGEFVGYVGLDFDGSTMLVPQWRDHGFTLRAVPEPGSLALLVVGSVVTAAWYLGRGRASRSLVLPHRRLKPSEVRHGGASLRHSDGVS